MSTKETYKRELEQMLDGGHSTADILTMLSEVCSEKADHIRENWQDEPTAKRWDARARALEHEAFLTVHNR